MIQLYPYQVAPAQNLLRSLRENRVACDASDTGTGKSYVAAWIAQQLHLPVLIICPKAVVPMWGRIMLEAGVKADVVNYEKLRTGNTPHGRFEIKRWVWASLDPERLIIFDEFHRAKSPTSLVARIAAASKPFRVLGLSATLAQDPTEMRALGFLLGLHNWFGWYKWALRNGCWRSRFGALEFKKKSAATHLLALHEQIFPAFGSRVRIADLGDAFPESLVSAEVYDFGNTAQVNAAYDAVVTEQNRRIAAGEPENVGALVMQARLKAEVLKAEGLASMAQDLIAEGNSVVIFTSFRETLEKLRAKLKCDGIYGGQNENERQAAIDRFQRDESRVIVANSKAGGQGIGLHDTRGEFPRVTLICPMDSAADFIQVLGRTPRQGGKSKCIQKIVGAAGTYEEKIIRRVQAKKHCITLLNDGDLNPLEAQSTNLSNEIAQKEDLACKVSDTCYDSALQTSVTPIECREFKSRKDASPLDSEPGADDLGQGRVGDKRDHTFLSVTAGETAERKHAPLSPSVLKSKAICPGFRNDPDGDRSFADRGTLGHKAVETEDLSLVAHDPALKIAVEKCIGYKHRLIFGPRYEQEVRLDYFTQYGYADFISFTGRAAHLADWKFAFNFYPADSPQFHAYCIGVWDRWSVEDITVHAVHPFRDEIDIETFTRAKDYDRLSRQVAAIIARARRDDPADYTVSAQCAYCGQAGKCTKLASLGLEIARRYSADLVLPDIDFHGSHVTDPAHFEVLLRAKPIVEKAAEGWHRAALEMHDSGTLVPGCEISTRAGRKSILSARGAYELLRKEVAPDLPPEDFIENCTITNGALDDLVKAAAPVRKKGRTVEHFNALLMDADLVTQGGGGRYIRPVRV